MLPTLRSSTLRSETSTKQRIEEAETITSTERCGPRHDSALAMMAELISSTESSALRGSPPRHKAQSSGADTYSHSPASIEAYNANSAHTQLLDVWRAHQVQCKAIGSSIEFTYAPLRIVPELPQRVCLYCVGKLEVTHELVKQENLDSSLTDLDSNQPTTDSADINNGKSQNTGTNEITVENSDSNCSTEDFDQSNTSTAIKFTKEGTQEMTESEAHFTSEIEIEEHKIKLELREEQLDSLPKRAAVKLPLKSRLLGCQVLVPKLLECELCSFYTSNKTELATHMQTHQAPITSDVTFRSLPSNGDMTKPINHLKCDTCRLCFSNPVMLARHSENCRKTGIFIRTVRRVPSSASSNKHSAPLENQRNIISASDVKAVTCKLCSKDFESERELKDHIASVHAKKRRKLCLKCEHCDLIFFSYPLLKLHCDNRHPGKYILQCDECKTEFTSYQGYMRHIKYRHESPHVFTCNLCTSTFKLPSNLKAHMKNLHSTLTKPFICSLCDARFKCERYLRLHIRGVHLGPILKCASCNYITRRKIDLKIHFKAKHSVHNKTISCKFCSAQFQCEEFLCRHVREVHSGPILRCNHCKYNTRRPADLIRHLKTMHFKK
ncbi:hypothetical protein B566_EDAN009826 [Ephemera danica]|nr:hypothetical protein B566_EDAN009826 [Ephemera danica]